MGKRTCRPPSVSHEALNHCVGSDHHSRRDPKVPGMKGRRTVLPLGSIGGVVTASIKVESSTCKVVSRRTFTEDLGVSSGTRRGTRHGTVYIGTWTDEVDHAMGLVETRLFDRVLSCLPVPSGVQVGSDQRGYGLHLQPDKTSSCLPVLRVPQDFVYSRVVLGILSPRVGSIVDLGGSLKKFEY